MARVYVGTYRKYNEGSLNGGWIDLADCADYSAFLSKCKLLHKNERDPEYMIQDHEDMPDGLSCLEWLSEQDFNDIKAELAQGPDTAPACTIVDYSEKAIAVTGDTRPIADKLKEMGGRFNPRLSCGPGWIFSKRKEDELRAVLAGARTEKGEQKKAVADDAQLRQEYLAYVEQMNDTEYWKGVYRKNWGYAVKLSDGWCIIDKPRIENKFCFHDEGPQYDFYCSLMADEKKLRNYFLSENLADIDGEIANLRKNEPLYTRPKSNNSVEVLTHYAIYGFYEYAQGKKEPRQITPEERASLLTAYGIIRQNFEKRLQAYLKKYGTSKLHTWTYWADA